MQDAVRLEDGNVVVYMRGGSYYVRLKAGTNAHSDDRDQSFQRIATSVTRVRDGAVGCCF